MFSVWANGYVAAQRDAVASINLKSVELVLSKLLEANKAGKATEDYIKAQIAALPGDEAKPAEVAPAEATPAETKPAEANPEAKPAA